jgi:hypothetical protein
MDNLTQEIIEHFIEYLSREMQSNKHYKHMSFGKWHLKDYKVTIEVYCHQITQNIYFDIRELKENKDRPSHLLVSALNQLSHL